MQRHRRINRVNHRTQNTNTNQRRTNATRRSTHDNQHRHPRIMGRGNKRSPRRRPSSRIISQLRKLAFDSIVQRDAPDANYGRSFARFKHVFNSFGSSQRSYQSSSHSQHDSVSSCSPSLAEQQQSPTC